MHHIVNRKRLDNSSPLYYYFLDFLAAFSACFSLIAACTVASLGGLYLNF